MAIGALGAQLWSPGSDRAAASMLTVSESRDWTVDYSPVGVDYASPRSCAKEVVRDYLEPLDRMRSIREPSASGRMPFAPRPLRLRVSGEKLGVGGGLIGFALFNKAYGQGRPFNWIVETELLKVDPRGVVVSSRGIKRRRMTSIRVWESRFLHRVPRDPGFYRVDVRFMHRGTGRLLGTYSTYARVVPVRYEMQMEVETPTVKPGEYAYATLTNFSTVPIWFERIRPFSVHSLVEGRWKRLPSNPAARPLRVVPKLIRRRGYRLSAGTALTGCLRYRVPTDQPPGSFRFTALWEEGGSETRALYSEFEVVSP